ncbi:MAG: ATP-binding cassette domain-containing protein [Mycobacteriales bacterium]
MNRVVIDARGVNFGFPREHPVLHDVSIQVADEVVAVTGSSGSGKTTLLLCLAGILVPSAGEITVNGQQVSGGEPGSDQPGSDERSRIRRQHLGLVFQFSELVAELSLSENVALPLELLGESRRESRRAALELLEELGIGAHADRFPAQVSGGQAQRAAVARALVH